jgi:PAS domain S-box-containing protein
MGWLVFGILYTGFYYVAGQLLAGTGAAFAVFRLVALVVPPLCGISVIVRNRHRWTGCHWLFWATIALGLATAAVGHIGWIVDELLLNRQTSWLGWHAVFIMFGAAAPLLALLAQPHRGSREKNTATIAVDIAGIAVVTGFLYSYMVTAEDLVTGQPGARFTALLALTELQPLIVFMGMTAASYLGRDTPWAGTYRRLALGLGLNFLTLTLSNLGIAQGLYRPGFVYDFVWIMPFMFFPWAAAHAPSSARAAGDRDEPSPEAETSQPWLIFAVLVLIPALDYLLRRTVPSAVPDGTRDLATAVSVVSVLPLLLARLAVERSEARRADDQLRLLGAAMQQAEELVVIRTIDRRFVYANDAYCRALGYRLGELRDANAHALFDAASAEESDLIVEGCRNGQPWRGTVTRKRSNGSTFPASVAVVPFGDRQGRITHLLSVERDVSEEMHLREQLIHSERLSAVGQLVSGVAHELNNPLQSVIGYTELLLDGETREGARSDLEQIKIEAMRAAGIVRNLLAFVRRSPTARAPENVNAVVKAALALRGYELKTSNIAVEESYGEPMPVVSMNREEIQQVLLNLILNAEQAMLKAHGAGTLRVKTSGAEDKVSVEVSDDGPGIPGVLAGKIFEPFFSTKGVGEGTGLGLSIALGIASAHGGSLDLIPTKRGACFRLTLPVPRPADPPRRAEIAEAATVALKNMAAMKTTEVPS